MAYTFEKKDGTIIWDGFEKGIADSPYEGVANIRNLSVDYYPGVAYPNYKRQAATLSGGTMGRPVATAQSGAGLNYILDDSQQVWKQNAVGGTTFTKVTSNPAGGTGYGLAWWQNYLVVFRSNAIDICGDGTGDSGITSSNWNTAAGTSGVWPIVNTTLTLSGTPASGATTATLSTYTDAQGNNRAFWNGPTGNYQLTLGNNQTVKATLTQGSSAITWSPALYSSGVNSTATLTSVFTSSTNHQAFVSPSDGNMYFCNNQYIGVLKANLATGYYTVDKTVMATFTFDYGVVRIQNETIGWLDQLYTNLVISGVRSIYLWDRTSPQVQAPLSIPETIFKTINVLNTIYIFAGFKGNIYSTNGYAASLLKKVPDGLFGLIDPYLQWGGVMGHRSKVFFQVFASTAAGTATAMGIFSLTPSNQVIALENENSFGYTTTGSASQYGVLIDYPTTNDSYYSAWYNNGAGGVDFNNTTLYQNFEPVIETDIVPVGTFLEKRTFENVEFKLDRQLAANDQIRVSYRVSLSDSYTVIGTSNGTGNLVISDNFNSGINSAQWLQLKVEFACASSSSSRLPLREIRIH